MVSFEHVLISGIQLCSHICIILEITTRNSDKISFPLSPHQTPVERVYEYIGIYDSPIYEYEAY
jgi:hypothetical protein